MMNFSMEKSGNLLLIKGRNERDNQGGFGGMTPEQIAAMMGGGEGNREASILRVYKIKFANASSVAQIVNDVFWQREQQNNPMQMFFGGGGGRNQGRNNNNNRGGFNFGNMQPGQAGPTVRASSDDYSNAVIVNAPQRQQFEVEALIDEIDQQTDAPQETKVYPLEFAMATDVVATVQSVLAANENTGRGGQTGNNSDFFSRISRAQRGITAGGGVVADTRTNSLVVTATVQNQTVIKQVIDELDHEVEYVDSTFVFPLSNARADDIAGLLNQAFGQNRNNRTGQGNTRNNQNTRNQGNQNTRNQGNQGGGGGGVRGGGELESDINGLNALLTDIEDPESAYGDLMTSVAIQGGFLGNAGRQNQQQQGAGGVARNAQGQIVNTRQAQGQVTIIADPNTNSLIVVGDPENAEMIRNILAQLDKIPEQVMIETIIVEATLDSSSKLGVEWNLVNGNFLGNSGVTGEGGTGFGLQTTPPAQGFSYTVSGGNLGGFLNALQTDEKFKVLSTPRIFTSNNVEAEINISQSVPFIVSQREDVNGNFIFNYSFQDVGIVLTVTPRITANGMVTLDVVQTANDLQGFTDFNAPIVNQRQAQTTVSVQDGATIVLGGIMRSQVRTTTKKIPLLGDIPILGELFKSREKNEIKTELLVFLTPRIVRNAEQSEQLKNDQVGGLSKSAKDQYQKVRPPTTTGGTGGTTTGGSTTGGN
jgi:general secretion pathway protein D